MENIYFYVRVSVCIVSIVSRSACMVEIAVIVIISDSAFKALKASLTTLISRGGV